jgi:hypothetical protein
MNRYLQAIERNEVKDFLFGYGEYFEKNDEWGEEAGHNSICSFIHIIRYGEEIGFDNLFRRLELDFTSILENNDISAREFVFMLHYFWFSFHYYSDGKKCPYDWIPSDRLCELYRLNFERLKVSDYCEYYLDIINNQIRNRYNYYLLEKAPYERNSKTTLHEVPQDTVGEYVVPEGIIRIRNYAFDGCRHITSVKMPDSVRSIEWYAFKDCTSLESVSISPNVDFIGEHAFDGCAKLKSFFIPASVRIISSRVLGGCTSLSKIEVAEDNKYFASKDGMLYSKDMTTLIKCPSKIRMCDIVIPEGVTTIEGAAINSCLDIKRIFIPKSLKQIYMSSIYDCPNVSELHIGVKDLTNFHVVDGLMSLADQQCVYYVPADAEIDELMLYHCKIVREKKGFLSNIFSCLFWENVIKNALARF